MTGPEHASERWIDRANPRRPKKDELRHQIKALRTEIDGLRKLLAAADKRNAELEARIAAMPAPVHPLHPRGGQP